MYQYVPTMMVNKCQSYDILVSTILKLIFKTLVIADKEPPEKNVCFWKPLFFGGLALLPCRSALKGLTTLVFREVQTFSIFQDINFLKVCFEVSPAIRIEMDEFV